MEQFRDDRVYFGDSILASYCGQAQTEGTGDIVTDTLCDWSRPSHVTVLLKKTKYKYL